MYNYLLLISLFALTGCGKLDETPPAEKKIRPPLEVWIKQRSFTDNFYIDSLGISIFYRLVETEDDYRMFTDFQPDPAFVSDKVKEITQKTGLKAEDMALYISFKNGPFASTVASVVGTPTDVFLKSRPLLTAQKMILVEGSRDFFSTKFPAGKAYTVRHTISPNKTLLAELRKSGVITTKNEADYIFNEFIVTSFGRKDIIPKDYYGS